MSFEDCRNLSDDAVAHISACRGLTAVDLSGVTRLTDLAGAFLAKLPRLAHVHLRRCWHITDATAMHLAKCGQLKTVDFEDCVKLTAKAAEFVSQCKELQTLSLRRCAKLTDAALAHLVKCPELQNLDLGGNGPLAAFLKIKCVSSEICAAKLVDSQ